MHTNRWLAAALLTVGLGWSAHSADTVPVPVPGNLPIAAQKAIVDLSNNLTAKDITERAKKVVADHDSCDISNIFAKTKLRGLGIGKLTELGIQDSIERLIQQLARRKDITETQLEKYRDDGLQVARVMQAMAEMAPHRATDAILKNAERLKEWQRVTGDFKFKTASFRKAIEEADPKQVRLSALALHHTCCDCHNMRE